MGIAKQRGTFAERKEKAIEAQKVLTEAQQENLKRLTESETQSEEYRNKVIGSVVQMQLNEYNNRRDAMFQALWRVDHTLTGITV